MPSDFCRCPVSQNRSASQRLCGCFSLDWISRWLNCDVKPALLISTLYGALSCFGGSAEPLLASPSAQATRNLKLARLAGAKPRNIVFILADDHRYDAMGFLGHPFLETPQMDAMARNGVHLQNAFVTTALCSPSRASILTGLYAHRHRVVDNNNPVPAGTVFFPQYCSRPDTRLPLSASGTWEESAMILSRGLTTG